MSVHNLILKSVVFSVAVAAFVGMSARDAHAGSCCSSGSSSSKSAGAADCHSSQPTARRRNDPPFQAPHGGQLTKALWNYYEVVYTPNETRVYLYDVFRTPLKTRGVQGSVAMRVRGNPQEFRYPVRAIRGVAGQDYLAVPVNVTRIRDGDMTVHFDLVNLPNGDSPNRGFVQTFAMTRPPQPYAGMGGTAIARNSTAPPQFFVSKATANDQGAVRAQKVCPVMQQPLGSHGEPTKIVSNGRTVFVCCDGCVDKVKQSPDIYLTSIVRGQQSDQRSYPANWFSQNAATNAGGSSGSSRASCH